MTTRRIPCLPALLAAAIAISYGCDGNTEQTSQATGREPSKAEEAVVQVAPTNAVAAAVDEQRACAAQEAAAAPARQPEKKAPPPKPEPAITGISWDGFDGALRIYFNSRPNIAKARDFIRFEPEVMDFSISGVYWNDNAIVVGIKDDSLRGTNIAFTVKAGMPVADGRTLGREYRRVFLFKDAIPSVRFASGGRYLAPLGVCAVGVETVNAKELEYSLSPVPARNIVQLLAREERSYSSWYGSVDDSDTQELAQKAVTGKLAVASRRNEKANVSVPIRDKDGKVACGVSLLSVKVADELPDDSTWEERNSRRPVYRLVCTTDIGLSVRNADGWIYSWTTSLATGYPESGIKVEVFASNGDLLGSDVSGPDGLAACEMPKDGEPFAVIASRPDGSDCAFLALSDRTFVDEVVSGSANVRSFIDAEECEAYVWTDRGIYRHGEPIMAQAIVRNGQGNAPSPFPLTMKLFDPKVREVSKVTGLIDEFGRFTADGFAAPDSMMSGTWTLQATIPGGVDGEDLCLGSTTIKIEEFVPPKVRVKIAEMPEEGLLPRKCHGADCANAEPMAFNVKVSAEHLFGGPASGLFASLAYSFEDAPFEPEGWKGWRFGDSTQRIAPNFETVDNVMLDEKGVAEFAVVPEANMKPSAAVRLTVQGSVRENGGRPATVRRSAVVHWRPLYIGCTVGDTVQHDDSGIAKRRVALVQFDGRKLAEKRKLSVKFDHVESNYNCVKDENGYYTWKCDKIQYPLSETTIETDENGEAEIDCPAGGWGEVAMRVSEPQSGASFAATYWIEWWSGGDDVLRAPMKDPTALSIVADKKVYRPGDVPVITVKSPFAGRAWITGMRKGVIANKVVTLTNLTSVVKLDAIEEDWAPGMDVAVTVVQSVKPSAKHRASRARGIVRMKITPADRQLDVKVTSEAKYTPGAGSKLRAEIAVTGEVEPGAVATVTAVDEGINLFTDQKVPDPAGWFAEPRRACTPLYDIYNRLLPVIDDMLKANGAKTGGGADAGLFGRVSPVPTRRFKPLSKWVRDVRLENGRGTVEFDLGEFTGEIRVTAVAANKTGTGAGAVQQKVSPKLVAQPDAPRFAAPGDTVTLTYTLSNRGDADCSAEYSLAAPGTNFAGTVAIAKGGSTTVEFPVELGDSVGEARLVYSARGLGEEHTEEILLPVRPAVAWEKTGETVVVGAGEERVFDLPADTQFRDLAERTFTMSGTPLAELALALSYLVRYPYGCLEQTTSQVFPLVAAGGVLNKLDVERTTIAEDARQAVNDGIARVVSMMRYDGFSMWPDVHESTKNSDVSVYEAHFLVEASRAGFEVPGHVLDDVKRFCRGWANDGTDDGLERSVYACMVLALAGSPEKAWMYDRYSVQEKLSATGRCRLSRSFALAGDRETAARLIADVKPVGSTLQLAEAVMAMCELDAKDARLPGFVAALLKARDAKRGHWLTTGENAGALMALATYYRLAGICDGKAEGALLTAGGEMKLEDGKHMSVRGAEAVKVVNKGSAPMYLAVETRRLPDAASAPAVSNGVAIETEVRRADSERRKVDPSSLKRGDNALVAVKMTVMNGGSIADYVIDLPLPACFEPGDASNFTGASREYELRREVRDDRVVIFTRPYKAKAGQTLEFTVPVSVVTSGRFAVPPATVDAMYIPEVNARSAASRVTIVK